MNVLVLAGGFPQIELIRQLHERGYFVILADYNEEPVARSCSDKYYRVSTLDIEAIKKIAINENVIFLITVCTDQALVTVAKVSQDLGLPCYLDYPTALNVTNKQYMKSIFLQKEIPSSKFLICKELNYLTISNMTFPLIVKPVDCNSSKGVKKAQNFSELEKYFNEAQILSRSHGVIIEEYIDGVELSVDAYVENGKSYVLCVTVSEKIPDSEKFVIFRTQYPAIISNSIKKQISQIVQQIADAFLLKNCPLLVQCLTKGDNCSVIEFSARTGGGVKHFLIRNVTGFDPIKAIIDLTLGIIPHYEQSLITPKYLIDEYVYCKPGVFDHLEGAEELKKMKIITDFYLFKWKGYKFDEISNSGDRVAGFTIQDKSFEGLLGKHEKAYNTFKVIDNNGYDIMRHDILKSLAFKEIE